MTKNFLKNSGLIVLSVSTLLSTQIKAQVTLISPTGDGGFESGTTVAAYTLSHSLAGTTPNPIFMFNSDNVSLTHMLLPCPAPSGVTLNGITSTSAGVSWVPSGSEPSWDIYYGPLPLTSPTSTTVPSATTSVASYTLAGLTPASHYEFYVRAHCNASDQSSWSGPVAFMTPCQAPAITGTTPSLRCGAGTATLGATVASGGTLNWYAASTGGAAVGTGSVFTTPTLNSTTNYYVSSAGAPYTSSGGIITPIPTGSISPTPSYDGIMFNATQTFTLLSVDVYPNGPFDDITIELYNGASALVGTFFTPIPPLDGTMPVTLPLNFVVPAGTNYHFEVNTTMGTPLVCNTGVTYPYPIGSVGSITSGYSAGAVAMNYNYLYNFQVSSVCESPRTMVTASVTPSPTVAAAISSSVICSGATLTLTASGATTYSWMPNSSASATTTATPTVSTTYTVTGANGGCTNTKTLSVTVNDAPTLTVTTNPVNGTLCTTGATATLTATGTSTAYAWSNTANTASASVTPTTTTVYSVTGTNSCGVKTVTVSVTVATTPTISAATSSSLSCANSSVVLTTSATPGVSYSWNTGATTTSISVSPSVTTIYTVTGTNACGTATATVVQNVSACTGIEDLANGNGISIYPNPASNYVNIAIPASLTSGNTTVEVTDALGKVVMNELLNTDVTTLNTYKLEDGIYFFKVTVNNQTIKVSKVVKH